MNMPRQLFGENYRSEAIVIPNRVGLDDMGRENALLQCSDKLTLPF